MKNTTSEEKVNIIDFPNRNIETKKEEFTEALLLWRKTRAIADTIDAKELGSMPKDKRIDALRKSLLLHTIEYYRSHPRADVAPGVLVAISLLSDNEHGASDISQTSLSLMFGRSKTAISDAKKRLRDGGQITASVGRFPRSRPIVPRALTLNYNHLAWIVSAYTSSQPSSSNSANDQVETNPIIKADLIIGNHQGGLDHCSSIIKADLIVERTPSDGDRDPSIIKPDLIIDPSIIKADLPYFTNSKEEGKLVRKKESNITSILPGERESEREGGGLPSKVAAALAISIAAATTPCAATEPLSSPLQAIQIHDLKFESSWPSTAPAFAEPVKVAQQVLEFVEATEPAKTSTPAKPSAGTTRLSADWFLPKPWGQWAVHNCKRDAEWVRIQAAKFKKFWLSETDKKGFKKNWERTWQNWCRNALTSEAKHNGGRPFAKAEVGTEQFEVTQDSISGPGFVIDLKAVEMTATLAMCDPERARLIAEICARDWLANGQKPSSPMAVIKGAIIGDKNRGQQHDLRMQLEEQRGSGRSKTL